MDCKLFWQHDSLMEKLRSYLFTASAHSDNKNNTSIRLVEMMNSFQRQPLSSSCLATLSECLQTLQQASSLHHKQDSNTDSSTTVCDQTLNTLSCPSSFIQQLHNAIRRQTVVDSACTLTKLETSVTGPGDVQVWRIEGTSAGYFHIDVHVMWGEQRVNSVSLVHTAISSNQCLECAFQSSSTVDSQLLQCLLDADWSRFVNHISQLSTLYKLAGVTRDNSLDLWNVFCSMENELERMSCHALADISKEALINTHTAVHCSKLGLFRSRGLTYLTKLTFFISPRQLIIDKLCRLKLRPQQCADPTTRVASTPLHDLRSRDLGLFAELVMVSSSQPHETHEYSVLTSSACSVDQKCIRLPCVFSLRLSQSLIICDYMLDYIRDVTGLVQHEVRTVPHNIVCLLIASHTAKNSNGCQLCDHSYNMKPFTICLPNVHKQHYYIEDNQCLNAAYTLSNVHFLFANQLPLLICTLREAAIFQTLLESITCVGTIKTANSDAEKLNVSVSYLRMRRKTSNKASKQYTPMLSITFTYERCIYTLEITGNLSQDGAYVQCEIHISEAVCCAEIDSSVTPLTLSKLCTRTLNRTLSVPTTLRAVCTYLDGLRCSETKQQARAQSSEHMTLSSVRDAPHVVEQIKQDESMETANSQHEEFGERVKTLDIKDRSAIKRIPTSMLSGFAENLLTNLPASLTITRVDNNDTSMCSTNTTQAFTTVVNNTIITNVNNNRQVSKRSIHSPDHSTSLASNNSSNKRRAYDQGFRDEEDRRALDKLVSAQESNLKSKCLGIDRLRLTINKVSVTTSSVSSAAIMESVGLGTSRSSSSSVKTENSCAVVSTSQTLLTSLPKSLEIKKVDTATSQDGTTIPHDTKSTASCLVSHNHRVSRESEVARQSAQHRVLHSMFPGSSLISGALSGTGSFQTPHSSMSQQTAIGSSSSTTASVPTSGYKLASERDV